jgi:flavin reductase (DIM6/NTAB) family NADH-FMN oxidoreductase RutF
VYYEPSRNDHGLARTPFTALVVPRPIGWISTINPAGKVNLAPYSYFNAVSNRPPMVMFASTEPKDSRHNAEVTGEFVASLASFDLREEMGRSSEPIGRHESEPELIGLDMTPSRLVRTPRVAGAWAALECRYTQTVVLKDGNGAELSSAMVIGEVVGVHIDDRLIADGRVDITRAQPIGRLGYRDYVTVAESFSMQYPR